MNIQQFGVGEIQCGKEVKEVILCVLHTIMFHRALGMVVPKEVTLENLDVVYSAVEDKGIGEYLGQQASKFVEQIEKRTPKKGKLILSFYENKQKKIWYRTYQEKTCFEQWFLGVSLIEQTVMEEKEEQKRLKGLKEDVNKCISFILKTVNEKNSHIPSFKSSDEPIPFLYDVTTPVATDSSWVSSLWK
eukprot:TRINITY_DN16331_c0_g1_i1.p1 TRINITY_DN16331_c0_g1~~TRINITY_DN16331_c0_g1_i1.p1  ORF type:complete len:189 (-),score=48.73 TRINITY_DN16331_c0_g1_i1:2-568(-)